MKMNRNFRAFKDFKLLELEVPTICLVIGGVSGRRERRYLTSITKQAVMFEYYTQAAYHIDFSIANLVCVSETRIRYRLFGLCTK
jgi:hypothetical protein